jgi:hypothetical protein
MDVQTQIFGFYLIIIIAMSYFGDHQYPNDSGKEKGALLGVVLSVFLWDQYGRKAVADAKSY